MQPSTPTRGRRSTCPRVHLSNFTSSGPGITWNRKAPRCAATRPMNTRSTPLRWARIRPRQERLVVRGKHSDVPLIAQSGPIQRQTAKDRKCCGSAYFASAAALRAQFIQRFAKGYIRRIAGSVPSPKVINKRVFPGRELTPILWPK